MLLESQLKRSRTSETPSLRTQAWTYAPGWKGRRIPIPQCYHCKSMFPAVIKEATWLTYQLPYPPQPSILVIDSAHNCATAMDREGGMRPASGSVIPYQYAEDLTSAPRNSAPRDCFTSSHYDPGHPGSFLGMCYWEARKTVIPRSNPRDYNGNQTIHLLESALNSQKCRRLMTTPHSRKLLISSMSTTEDTARDFQTRFASDQVLSSPKSASELGLSEKCCRSAWRFAGITRQPRCVHAL